MAHDIIEVKLVSTNGGWIHNSNALVGAKRRLVKYMANVLCLSAVFKCLNTIFTQIASAAKKTCIMMHLFTFSLHEFTETFEF